MQYLLLIYDAEKDLARMTPEEGQKMHDDYMKFTMEIMKSGHHKAGNALQSTQTATTVRTRNGKTTTTDGPFAETREQLGGFYLVEAANLDEALKIAARIPSAKTGSIEVRPIQVFDMPKP
jgi:hypothetical protein